MWDVRESKNWPSNISVQIDCDRKSVVSEMSGPCKDKRDEANESEIGRAGLTNHSTSCKK